MGTFNDKNNNVGQQKNCKMRSNILKKLNDKTNFIDALKYLKYILINFYIEKFDMEALKFENKYKYSKENYDRILKGFKELAKKLDLQNSLEISILYSYLMWNGYFSKNKKLYYQEENRALMSGMYSYDVINGNGVCLNFSDFLRDILNECGYSSSVLTSLVDEYPIKSSYEPGIKRNYIESSENKKIPFVYKFLINKVGNHALNLIEDKEKFYIYDSTNLRFLTLDDINTASVVLGSGKLKIFPYLSYLHNTRNERVAMNRLCSSNDLSSPYSTMDYIVTTEKCLNLFAKNKKLFNNYYKEIYSDILKISEIVEEYKEKEDIKLKK